MKAANFQAEELWRGLAFLRRYAPHQGKIRRDHARTFNSRRANLFPIHVIIEGDHFAGTISLCA
jgi:hypothetical protein